MASRRYPSDLSDEEWRLLEPDLPASKRRGRPRLHSRRQIVNAVFYVLKSGCQWRMLPKELECGSLLLPGIASSTSG